MTTALNGANPLEFQCHITQRHVYNESGMCVDNYRVSGARKESLKSTKNER